MIFIRFTEAISSKKYNIYPNGIWTYYYSIENIEGTNLLLGPPEIFFRRNPSGTFRDVHWYHLDGPKKVPGAPSQGFLIFLGFDKNITKIENWLSFPHFWANF